VTNKIDREFAGKFLGSAEDFYAYGVHLLFNDWWERAPEDAIAKYVEAIETHPEQGPLAAEAWYADPLSLEHLREYPEGTLGHAYLRFMVDNGLAEKLATGYRELHESIEAEGRLDRLPPVLKYKVLRGYQTHDLHHVLTGFPATPLGELGLQAFELAQTPFPYAAMWVSVVTAHMTFVDPYLITPAMDAISQGWAYGRRARSLQFVKFETMLGKDLVDVRRAYELDVDGIHAIETPSPRTPELLAA